jgi:hypothetical protein
MNALHLLSSVSSVTDPSRERMLAGESQLKRRKRKEPVMISEAQCIPSQFLTTTGVHACPISHVHATACASAAGAAVNGTAACTTALHVPSVAPASLSQFAAGSAAAPTSAGAVPASLPPSMPPPALDACKTTATATNPHAEGAPASARCVQLTLKTHAEDSRLAWLLTSGARCVVFYSQWARCDFLADGVLLLAKYTRPAAGASTQKPQSV